MNFLVLITFILFSALGLGAPGRGVPSLPSLQDYGDSKFCGLLWTDDEENRLLPLSATATCAPLPATAKYGFGIEKGCVCSFYTASPCDDSKLEFQGMGPAQSEARFSTLYTCHRLPH